MRVLRWPVERILPVVGLLLLWLITRPPRKPRLDRIAYTAKVRRRRAVAVAWLDEQFNLIESAVPALDHANVAVDDSIWLSRAGLGIAHSDRWCVSATRRVTAVYGVTGDAGAHLAALAAAAGAAGWGYYGFPDPVARLEELLVGPLRDHGVCAASPGWRPQPGITPPPGWEPPANPRATARPVRMSIQAERQQAVPATRAPTCPRWPESLPVATPFHYPVERTEADVAALAERTLAWTGQVIAVTIAITYYER
jgi:hypothetical protein